MTARGTGITSDQMKSAQYGAVYIWCNDSLQYPKALALFLVRSDLKIVQCAALSDCNSFRGLSVKPVLDHAAVSETMTLQQFRNWNEIRDYWSNRK